MPLAEPTRTRRTGVTPQCHEEREQNYQPRQDVPACEIAYVAPAPSKMIPGYIDQILN